MDIKTYLRLETTAATGCTEPAAVGLGASAAAELLPGERIDAVEVLVDPNLYKNGMGVFIPGSGGACGLELAAAMGAVVGDSSRGLEVFGAMDADKLDRARTLIREHRVTAGINHGVSGLYVRVRITGQSHVAEALTRDRHDNIVSLLLNGKEMPVSGSGADAGDDPRAGLEEWLQGLTVKDMLALLDDLDDEDFQYLRKGLDLNMALAEHGREHRSGMGVGRALEELAEEGLLQADMASEAAAITCAGVDARMGGVQMPATALCGSGNQGISAGLPLTAVARRRNSEETELLRALALSYLATGVVKSHIGRLSALCGSALASGIGVAMGTALLMGGSPADISGAAVNFSEEAAGMICDGAKTSCAVKLSASVVAAVKSALLSMKGVVVSQADGIAGKGAEDTMEHLGALSKGMMQADQAILQVMLAKRV